MNKRSNIKLPQKQLSLKIKFEEKVLCNLSVNLKGLKEEQLSKEDKEKDSFTECPFPVSNPFMPQCISCLANNKNQKFMQDKNKREYKVL